MTDCRMFGILHLYPAYKPSGVDWLVDVPEHWDARRIKTLFQESVERKGQSQIELLSLTRTRGLIPQSENAIQTLLAEDLSRYKVCRPTDIVMNRMQAWSGMFAVPKLEGLVSPDYCVFSPVISCEIRYFEHLFKLPEMVGQFAQLSKGLGTGFNRLYTDDFGSIRTIVPPLPEQRAVVRYLDYVDRRIRRYVSVNRKLIGLLEEEKQAVVNRAVRRGLDLNVRLKPSGVEWLGNVPEDWEVRRGKRLFSPRRELARPDDIQLSATQAYGVIPQDEYEERIGRRIVKISLHLNQRRHVEVDDFVISMRSFQGGLERAWASGCIRSSYIVLRPAIEVDVEFFSYVFKSQAYIQALRSTANFIRDGQDLTFDNFCAVDLPFPPAEEQRNIAVALREATADISAAIVRARRQIELVQEYRTRLIADVVTGKLDVREAAAQLPDETDEEPIDGGGLVLDNMDDSFSDVSQLLEEEQATETEVTA